MEGNWWSGLSCHSNCAGLGVAKLLSSELDCGGPVEPMLGLYIVRLPLLWDACLARLRHLGSWSIVCNFGRRIRMYSLAVESFPMLSCRFRA